MIYGNIVDFRIYSMQEEIDSMTPDDKGCKSYIIKKHQFAEKKNCYVVCFTVDDKRITDHLSTACAFIPKPIINNRLIERNTFIEFCATSCWLEIAGVDSTFDRATNAL